MNVNKTVTLRLVGLDGNAHSLMSAFSRQARREGWDEDEIEAVIDECWSGDYYHLLRTLLAVCVAPGEEEYNMSSGIPDVVDSLAFYADSAAKRSQGAEAQMLRIAREEITVSRKALADLFAESKPWAVGDMAIKVTIDAMRERHRYGICEKRHDP